ncbi:MAG: cell wall hydrolase [Lachnospiraceae bacterium]|nr:cell wall hydrolase [Lachnospiraceae bacterium]
MAKSRRLLVAFTGVILFLVLGMQTGMTVQAGSTKNYLNELNGGIAAILNPVEENSQEVIIAMAEELNLTEVLEKEESTLVMANVRDALNVRSDASENASKVGKLYKDCGGTILERKDGWTKLQSGNVIGWASDEYLLFDEEAEAMANDVGRLMATINTETLRVRTEPNVNASVYGLLPKGEIVEALSEAVDGWVCIDYEGEDGYVSAEYVALDFQIDFGETIEEIKAREAAEEAAKREAMRHKNYGAYTTDTDTTMLLAALVKCEAGGESYEGQLAVASVVMNRVRSGAYPNSIHGVIYASGQFTPALNGKVNAVLESGKIPQSCITAAQEAISGISNVGTMTHFRRNNGREGLVIGNHVFY